MLTIEAITAALQDRPDAPEISFVSGVVILGYADHDTYSRRVSADVEALRAIGGQTLVESWSPAPSSAETHVHLRFAPAPAAPRVVDVPQPVAPRPFAPVPASPSRRR